MKDKKKLVILDTHAILHRAYHALPEFSSSKGEPTGALYGIVSMLVKIINDLKPNYIVAAYDLPGPTYRHAAYEKYKATRPKGEPDLIAQIIRSRDVIDAFGIPRYVKESGAKEVEGAGDFVQVCDTPSSDQSAYIGPQRMGSIVAVQLGLFKG